MRKLAAVLIAALVASPAFAERHGSTGSEASLLATGSVVTASAIVIAAPVLVVGSMVVGAANHIIVDVSTKHGSKEKLALPKEVVAKANLQPGDQLTTTPTATGAILSKNQTPVVFLVRPDAAKLSRSHELAR